MSDHWRQRADDLILSIMFFAIVLLVALLARCDQWEVLDAPRAHDPRVSST